MERITNYINKGFPKSIEGYDVMMKMRENALNHTDYEKIPKEFQDRRPNESKTAYEFAQKNYRRITHELFDNWLSKSGRIFNKNGFFILNETEPLKKRLEENDIFVNGWVDYIRQEVYPESLIDPNQFFFFFPFNPDSLESPEKSLEPFRPIGLRPQIVGFDKVLVKEDGLFIYESDEYHTYKHGLKTYTEPYLYAVDDDYWYKLTPRRTEKNKQTFTVEVWYQHDFESFEVIPLAGRDFKTQDRKKYKKSIIAAAFEHLNEFVGLFKDDQAVALLHSYPHMYMAEIDCQTCEATGTMTNGDTCKNCRGTGYMQKPDPAQVTKIPRTGLNEAPIHSPIMGWAYPGVDIMIQMDSKATNRFRAAFLSIGLRPFIDVAESGEAKKHRLEDLQDRLEECAELICVFSSAALTMLNTYLYRGAGNFSNEKINVSKPKGYQALSGEELNQLINTNNILLREDYFRQIYIEKVGNSPTTKKILNLVLLFAPLTNKTNLEITELVNLGAFDRQDVVKATFSFRIFEELSLQPSFLQQDIPTLLSEAEILMASWGLLKPSINNVTD